MTQTPANITNQLQNSSNMKAQIQGTQGIVTSNYNYFKQGGASKGNTIKTATTTLQGGKTNSTKDSNNMTQQKSPNQTKMLPGEAQSHTKSNPLRDSNQSVNSLQFSSSSAYNNNQSHFSINNLQSTLLTKSPFYSPKNVQGGIQSSLMNVRPGTALGQTNTVAKQIKENHNKSKSKQEMNETNISSRQLNASTSRANLTNNASKHNLHSNYKQNDSQMIKTFNNMNQESTMLTFSPCSTNWMKMSPASSNNFSKQQHQIASPSSQLTQQNLIQNMQGQSLNNTGIQGGHINPQTQIESFKSTFVNFRPSMRENVHARKPNICDKKKSPGTSPVRTFPITAKLESLGSTQLFDRQLYEDFISTNLNNDEIIEMSQDKKLYQSNGSKKQQVLPYNNNSNQSNKTKQSNSAMKGMVMGGLSLRNSGGTTRETVNSVTTLQRNVSPKIQKVNALQEQLWIAAESGNQNAITKVLSQGVDVNSQNINDDGWTALHYASHEGLDETVEFLIRKCNANVNILSSNGRTPLHIACNRQNRKVIERLLLGGASTNIKQLTDGNSPIHLLAKFSNDSELIKLLLPFSQNCLKTQNMNGQLPFQMSYSNEIRNLLMPQNQDVYAKEIKTHITQAKEPKVKNPSVIQSHIKSIQINQCESKDVKSIFDRMNMLFSQQQHCVQPSGEHDSDDIDGESSIYHSFDKSKINSDQSPVTSYISANPAQNDDKLDEVIQCELLVSPKSVGPKVLQQSQSSAKFQAYSAPKGNQKQQQQHQEPMPAKKDSQKIKGIQGKDEISAQYKQYIVSPKFAQESQNQMQASTRDTTQIKLQVQAQKVVGTTQRQTNGKQSNMRSPVVKNFAPSTYEYTMDKQLVAGKYGPDSFIAHQLLGTGSFGEVYLVEKISSKKLYAMKILAKSKIRSQNLIKYAMTERNVMSIMEHPFIVRLRYSFQTQDKLFLICDYCPGGDLSQYLEIERQFSEEKAKFYICEILLAIEALHDRDIIFRDLKPDNVVLDEQGHALLTDFGLSKEGVFLQNEAKSFCGSYAYLAPEMIKKVGHGKAVDWYLLGVVFFEMLTGMPPYYADEKEVLFKNIMNNQLELPDNITPLCKDLLTKLLNKNPHKRLGSTKGAQDIKDHPFFEDINWKDVELRKLKPPEPYLAEYARNIIQINPYMAAGNPKTKGKPCQKDHPHYVQGWSFADHRQSMANDALQGGVWQSPPSISVPSEGSSSQKQSQDSQQ